MDNGSSYQMELSPEEFRNLESNIASNIQKTSQNVSSMSKMVSQLQTPQDSPQLRNELRHIQQYTQQLVRDTSLLLKKIMRGHVSDNIARLSRDKLRDEYMATLNAFQVAQRLAAQKSRDDINKTKAQFVKIKDPFALNNEASLPTINENTSDLQQQEQLTVDKQRELDELEERERDIHKLERDIVDVNQIFKDLGTMIHDQGHIVDSIEMNMENTVENVHRGTDELRQAVVQKDKLRKRKVIIVVVLVIVACIIGVVIFSK